MRYQRRRRYPSSPNPPGTHPERHLPANASRRTTKAPTGKGATGLAAQQVWGHTPHPSRPANVAGLDMKARLTAPSQPRALEGAENTPRPTKRAREHVGGGEATPGTSIQGTMPQARPTRPADAAGSGSARTTRRSAPSYLSKWTTMKTK